MDSVQGLMNVGMVNNLEETGAAPEERSTVEKVKETLGAVGTVVQFLCWLLGRACPTPLRHTSRALKAVKAVGYTHKAYGILKDMRIPNEQNGIPFEDGGMSTREYLDYTPTNQQYLDYNSSFDMSSVFKKEF